MTRAVVEQFRQHDEAAGTTLVYEENHDMFLAVQAIEDTTPVLDHAEAQLLVRHNVDDEGITVVRLGRHGDGDNAVDAKILSEIIEALQETRDALAGFARGGAQ